MTFQELLIKLNACEEAQEWADDMTIEQVVEQCHRGDWLLWLAAKVNVNKRKLTLAKGHCANTVRHLMNDERSIKAVDTAIAYGEGNATDEELKSAAGAATDAVYAAADVVYAAAYAADAAADAADATGAATDAAADAAHAADAADAAAYAAAAEVIENQLQTADICRKYIGNDIIQQVKIMCNEKETY